MMEKSRVLPDPIWEEIRVDIAVITGFLLAILAIVLGHVFREEPSGSETMEEEERTDKE